MSGFWVTLYKQTSHQYANDTVVGYLYCCETTDCTNVAQVANKTDLKVCPKCGEEVSQG